MESFPDRLLGFHMSIASAVNTSWFLFDSGAASHCCPRDFAADWPLLPLEGGRPPLRSVTGQAIELYGRRPVGCRINSVTCTRTLSTQLFLLDDFFHKVSKSLWKNMIWRFQSPHGRTIELHRNGSYCSRNLRYFLLTETTLNMLAFTSTSNSDRKRTTNKSLP